MFSTMMKDDEKRLLMSIPLREIRYSQDSIGENFQKHGPITRLRDDLVCLYDVVNVSDNIDSRTKLRSYQERVNAHFSLAMKAPIGVVKELSKKVFTLDNRRLWCVKSAIERLQLRHPSVDFDNFELEVHIESKAQHRNGTRHAFTELDRKNFTVTDGLSVVVLPVGSKQKVSEMYGQSAYQLVFPLEEDGELSRVFEQSSCLIHDVISKHKLESITKECGHFDGETFFYVSIIADEMFLYRHGSAIYNELQLLGKYLVPEKDTRKESFDQVYERATKRRKEDLSFEHPTPSPLKEQTALDMMFPFDTSVFQGRSAPVYQSGLNVNKAPIDDHRHEIMANIWSSDVTIIRAETGSGKSTRVPLLIRDAHHTAQRKPRILLTQPRRVATISTAKRIAASIGQELQKVDDNAARATFKPHTSEILSGGWKGHLGEGDTGSNTHSKNEHEVGYMIRGEKAGKEHDVTIAVCTTGWLLHRMRSDPEFFRKWDYILLDEVHERTIEIDFMALFCKDALLNPAGHSTARDSFGNSSLGLGRTKIVIMSATVENTLFENYFRTPMGGEEDGAHGVGSSRSSFPQNTRKDLVVNTYDVKVPTYSKFVLHLNELQSTIKTRQKIVAETKKNSVVSSVDKNMLDLNSLPPDVEKSFTHLSTELNSDSKRAIKKMLDANTNTKVDIIFESYRLICDLVKQFGRGQESILVVMPGLEQIHRLQDELNKYRPIDLREPEMPTDDEFESVKPIELIDESEVGVPINSAQATAYAQPAQYFEAYVLHSVVPIEEQKHAVKDSIRPGCCRIYIATNIAESSLTLPKVRVVIDSGMHRQSIYDAKRRTSTLETRWISKASVKQREGRTGREFCGINIRLFTKEHFEDEMQDHETPLINISPMESSVLQCLALLKHGRVFTSLTRSLGVPTPHQQQRMTVKTILNALPTPPPTDKVDQTLLSLAGTGAICSPHEMANLTMLGHTALLLELEVPLAALVLFSTIWGKPLEGILIAAAGSLETPFVPENGGFENKPDVHIAKEIAVAKDNKRLHHVAAHFSQGVMCEHVRIRNLLVQLLIDFGEEKRWNVAGILGKGKGKGKNFKPPPKSRRNLSWTNAGVSSMFRNFVATWIKDYSDKLKPRRLETIVNTARDLAEKVSQNSLRYSGLKEDLKPLVEVLSPEMHDYQKPFGDVRIEEIQGLLLASFSSNFVTLKNKLVDSDSVLKEVKKESETSSAAKNGRIKWNNSYTISSGNNWSDSNGRNGRSDSNIFSAGCSWNDTNTVTKVWDSANNDGRYKPWGTVSGYYDWRYVNMKNAGNNPINNLMTDAKGAPAQPTSSTAATTELSISTLNERRLLIDLAVRFGDLQDVFLLEAVPQNRFQEANFPVDRAFSKISYPLSSRLEDITRADTASVESICEKKIAVKFRGYDIEELGEGDATRQYIRLCKKLLSDWKREEGKSAMKLKDIEIDDRYEALKKGIGCHTPSELFDFLTENEECRSVFHMEGQGTKAKLWFKEDFDAPSDASDFDVPSLEPSAKKRRVSADAPKKTSLSNKISSNEDKSKKQETRISTLFPQATCPIRAPRRVFDADDISISRVEVLGRLLELHKGRRRELRFDKKDGKPFKKTEIAIANITSPFCFKWLFPDSDAGFFRSSNGSILPAWRGDQRVLEYYGGGSCHVAPRKNVPAYPEDKLQMPLAGHDYNVARISGFKSHIIPLKQKKMIGEYPANKKKVQLEERSIDLRNRHTMIPRVIGTKFERKNKLEEISGCKLQFPPKENTCLPIKVTGPAEVLTPTCEAVEELLDNTNPELVLQGLTKATKEFRSKMDSERAKDPIDDIARNHLTITGPPQVLAIYHKGALNSDNVQIHGSQMQRRLHSATLSGVSVLNYENPNILPFLLLVFANPRLQMKVRVNDNRQITALQSGTSAVVSGCELPVEGRSFSLKGVNNIRNEISRIFQRCLPDSREIPGFEKSQSCRAMFHTLLESKDMNYEPPEVLYESPLHRLQQSDTDILLNLHTKDSDSILGAWEWGQSFA